MSSYKTGGNKVSAADPTISGLITFSSGSVVSAGSYQFGRDSDATNQLHLNVPTGATFEFSVNDSPQFVLGGSASGSIFSFSNSTITTGFYLNIGSADSLTSGAAIRVVSNSASATGRNLVFIRNQNTAATSTTACQIIQNAANATLNLQSTADGNCLTIDQQGNANSIRLVTTSQTTASIISVPNADSLTSASAFNFVSNSASATSRSLFFIRNQNASAVAAVNMRLQQDATASALVLDMGAVSRSTNGAFVINDAGTSGAPAIDINKTGDGYTNNLGTAIDIVRSGNFTIVTTEICCDLNIQPTCTITEPSAGASVFIGAKIDLSSSAVTAAAGDLTTTCLYLNACGSVNSKINYALFVDSGISRIDGMIDMSQIAAGSPNFTFTATSDTPGTTWTAGVPNANPSGYVEILVGASTRYIPFWA